MRRARVFFVFVVMFALAGCETLPALPVAGARPDASLAPLPAGEPSLDPNIVARADPRSVTRPLDAYRNSRDVGLLIARARIITGDECMRRFGLQPDPGWQPDPPANTLNFARYGLWDAAYALDHGYEPPSVAAENSRPLRYSSPDATDVYLGQIDRYAGQPVPRGGCQGEEIAALTSGVPSTFDNNYVSKLDDEAMTRARQDSRVTSLMDQWVSCMHANGWNYPNVAEPFAYWSTRRGADKFHPVVSANEKAAAKSDLACKQSTTLLGTWLAADIAYQRAIIAREGDRLTAFHDTMATIVARANTTIAGR